MILLLYAGWGMYKLKRAAWWLSVILIVVWVASILITFYNVDITQYYQKMGFPPEQVEMMNQQAVWNNTSKAYATGIWGFILLAYFIWTKKYYPCYSKKDLSEVTPSTQ